MAYGYANRHRIPESFWADLYQEARIAFFMHLRRIREAEDVAMFFIHVKYAMIRFLESTAMVSIPHKLFTEEIKRFSHAPMFDAEQLTVDYDNDMLTEVCVEQFLNSLTPQERMIFQMRIAGRTNREIKRALDIEAEYIVSRNLARLKKRFHKYYCGQERL